MGKTHYKWQFSRAMLVYQRVAILNHHEIPMGNHHQSRGFRGFFLSLGHRSLRQLQSWLLRLRHHLQGTHHRGVDRGPGL